jgi:hypothetical protein
MYKIMECSTVLFTNQLSKNIKVMEAIVMICSDKVRDKVLLRLQRP